jgi:uncharacterized membrane protein YphA (DoxX/SURF4 family)
MKEKNHSQLLPVVLTTIRILVGWHFLYEGIIKVAAENWSAYGYLSQARWIFSDFFRWLISNPDALAVADFLNIWGLVLIGTGLILGVFTRIASAAGVLLLAMYYIASPPFLKPSSEGHYFIINYQVIEAAVLMAFILIRRDFLWGIDRLLKVIQQNRIDKKFPTQVNHDILETSSQRREFIKNLAVLPVFGGVLFGMAKKAGWMSFEEEGLKKADAVSSASLMVRENFDLNKLAGKMPSGKIKNVEISRLLPGGNLVAGFAHARDLIYVSKWIKQYHSDEKVIETLWYYQDVGINTVILRTDEQTIRILKEFWRRGGKMQWLAQTYPNEDDLSNIQLAIDTGAIGAFVMGNIADKIVYNDKMDFLAKPIDFIKSQGLIAGTAAHAINTVKRCLDYGIEPDFLMKTLHHDQYWSAHPVENRNEYIINEGNNPDHNMQHDNIWCVDAEETTNFFRNLDIPWIAYKVLAAGAIKPEDGFNYSFKNGADFICVGMFDFQVIDNANIVYNTLTENQTRERKWYG